MAMYAGIDSPKGHLISGTAPPRMVRGWEVVERAEAADFGIFTAERRIAISPRNGQRFERVVLRSRDWVNVIAVTEREEIVLIEQYRHGIEQVVLEIPGGIIDEGESPLVAGARELREETGYAGDAPVLLGTVTPNPAFLTNVHHTILVTGARLVSDPEQDDSEDIAVRLVPRADIPNLMRDGQITHALVIAAFYWLDLRFGGR